MTFVNRRTFIASRGKQAEVVELLKEGATGSPYPYRIYTSYYGAFAHVVLETEFADMATLEAAWAGIDSRPGMDEFMARWYSVTEPGGANEVWSLEAYG